MAIETLPPSPSSPLEIGLFHTVFIDEQSVGTSTQIAIRVEAAATAIQLPGSRPATVTSVSVSFEKGVR